MLVQRGSVTLAAGTASEVVTLGTPVPVGQSFPLISLRSSTSDPRDAAVTATLQAPSGGNWTELALARTTSGGSTVVQWQVVTDPTFSVQTGETSLAANVTDSYQAITGVDLTRAFLVVTQRGPSGTKDARSTFVRATFSTASEIRLHRYTSHTSAVPVRWYAVEWSGATVLAGTTSTINAAVTIQAVDPATSFLIYSHACADDPNNQARFSFVRGRLTSATSLYFDCGWSARMGYFVVSHPDLAVQRADPTFMGGADTTRNATLGPAVVLAESFQVGTMWGNCYSTGDAWDTLHLGYTTVALTSTTNIELQRSTALGDNTLTYQVATYTPTGGGGTPPGTPGTAAVATSWDAVHLTISHGAGAVTTAIRRSTSTPVLATDALVTTLMPPDTQAYDTDRAASTPYHYRAFSTNADGTTAGGEASATTWADDAIETLLSGGDPVVIPFALTAGQTLTGLDARVGKAIRALAGLGRQVDLHIVVRNASNVVVGEFDLLNVAGVDGGVLEPLPLSPIPAGPQTVTATVTATIATS